jgi:hypothetical protein
VAALTKTTGLATLVALGLLLVWRNQSWSRRLVGSRSSWPMRIFVTGGLVLAGLAATRLVARLPGNVTLLYFCGPLWSLVAAGVVREFREARGGLAERLPPLVREAGPIAAGFGIVVAGYLALAHPDAASLRAFYEGVFVLPFSRLKDLVLGFDIAWYMLPAVLAGGSLVVALTCRLPEQAAVPASVFLAVIPWVFLGGSYTHPLTRESAYWIIRFALPAAAIGGAWIASLREDLDDHDRERAWLFMAAGAACMLMQYPFPAIHYAAYILPCWGLAAAALLRLAGQGNTLRKHPDGSRHLVVSGLRCDLARLDRAGGRSVCDRDRLAATHTRRVGAAAGETDRAGGGSQKIRTAPGSHRPGRPDRLDTARLPRQPGGQFSLPNEKPHTGDLPQRSPRFRSARSTVHGG